MLTFNQNKIKNIHILPTDKPSRLGQSVFNKSLHFNSIFNYELEKEMVIPQHIYITSHDEIKDCDYAYFPISNEVLRIGNGPFESSLEIVKDNKDSKKIILTTDQELIKAGIQAIDDEFLEWFVKNPSCEEVDLDTFSLGNKILYNVVFPKEEPKQETLEEAALKWFMTANKREIIFDLGWIKIFEAGAKWQQEQDKKCYHPMTERKHTSDDHFECTICGYNNY